MKQNGEPSQLEQWEELLSEMIARLRIEADDVRKKFNSGYVPENFDSLVHYARELEEKAVMLGRIQSALGELTPDAERYRALRESFPETETEHDSFLDRFVLHTFERHDGDERSSCTYMATTRAEFDDQMTEFMERAKYRQTTTGSAT